MYGDFSRVTYDPLKQYTGVLYQQGRVRLDAEDNEQQAIQTQFARLAMTDLVGFGAGPDGDLGFQIDPDSGKLGIGAGSYYVDGIRVENQTATQYDTQPYLVSADPADFTLPQSPYLVYLRVWERSVSAVSDPLLREVALGDLAPDTAERSQVIWQVRTATSLGNVPIDSTDAGFEKITDSFDEWRKSTASPAQLKARAKQDNPSTTPCVLSPDSEYRGPENQLYRVEVMGTFNDGTTMFKWSRDNGSVTFPVTAVESAVVTVTTLGRDGKTALEVGDLVELVDDDSGLDFEETAQKLHTVIAVDTINLTVTLESPVSGVIGAHPMLRRWDGEGVITSGEWLTLEDGIQVEFSLAGNGNYQIGDYWLIPARVATGDVQWPRDSLGNPFAESPAGLISHYAPLAIIRPNNGIEELRSSFVPISSQYQRGKPTSAQPKPTPPTGTTATTTTATDSTPAAPEPAAPEPTPEPTKPEPTTPEPPKSAAATEPGATEITAPITPIATATFGNPTAGNRLDQPVALVYPGPAPAAA